MKDGTQRPRPELPIWQVASLLQSPSLLQSSEQKGELPWNDTQIRLLQSALKLSTQVAMLAFPRSSTCVPHASWTSGD